MSPHPSPTSTEFEFDEQDQDVPVKKRKKRKKATDEGKYSSSDEDQTEKATPPKKKGPKKKAASKKKAAPKKTAPKEKKAPKKKAAPNRAAPKKKKAPKVANHAAEILYNKIVVAGLESDVLRNAIELFDEYITVRSRNIEEAFGTSFVCDGCGWDDNEMFGPRVTCTCGAVFCWERCREKVCVWCCKGSLPPLDPQVTDLGHAWLQISDNDDDDDSEAEEHEEHDEHEKPLPGPVRDPIWSKRQCDCPSRHNVHWLDGEHPQIEAVLDPAALRIWNTLGTSQGKFCASSSAHQQPLDVSPCFMTVHARMKKLESEQLERDRKYN